MQYQKSGKSFRVAVCDDEEYYRALERHLIERYMEKQGYHCTVDSYASGEEMICAFEKPSRYDIIFLDVSMNEMDGIETARHIRQITETVDIVFLSAYISYALDGYKVNAVRYLLKEDNSLENSLKECLDTITAKINQRESKYKIILSNGKKRIPADAILYVESRLHKVLFFVSERGSITEYSKYGKLDAVQEDSAVGILFIDFVVYRLANENMEREMKRREEEAFREKIKSEMAMYRSITENLDKQRKRTHEYKNQIAALSALAAAKKYAELDAYIAKIDTTLKLHEDAIDTNHVIVNAILNTKYREAANKGVSIILKINDLSKLNLDEEDIVIILSNLLDNAIEACSQCGEKTLKLKFVLEEEQIVISVENSTSGNTILKNGTFVTTKMKEPNEHGFGIRNVIETVEKYGGRYAVDHSGGRFLFSILIRNPFPNLS